MHTVFTTHPTLTDTAGNPAVDIETFSRVEDARAVAHCSMSEHGPEAVRIVIDVESFKDHQLGAYLSALNIEADWHAKNPKAGWWVSPLTEDIDHWNRSGVFTPVDLAAYLDAEVERERRKDAY